MIKNSALITMLVLLSSCAVSGVSSDRQGLLSYGSEGFDSIGRTHSDQKAVDELYRPKAGKRVNLPGAWSWPLETVSVSSPYGKRGRKFHQGLDLRASVGTPVRAASSGTVVYVGSRVRGYGRMVVLKHRGGFYSVYAHHSKNLVRKGKKVKLGQLIAYSGRSGRVSGPHLHFEIRRGTQSYDPAYAIRTSLASRDRSRSDDPQNKTTASFREPAVVKQ